VQYIHSRTSGRVRDCRDGRVCVPYQGAPAVGRRCRGRVEVDVDEVVLWCKEKVGAVDCCFSNRLDEEVHVGCGDGVRAALGLQAARRGGCVFTSCRDMCVGVQMERMLTLCGKERQCTHWCRSV
jgi:hypothetical protein